MLSSSCGYLCSACECLVLLDGCAASETAQGSEFTLSSGSFAVAVVHHNLVLPSEFYGWLLISCDEEKYWC